MIKYVFVLLVISVSVIGAWGAFAQCFNINMSIEGTIDQHESCPNIELVSDETCLVGNTLTNPSYLVRILTTSQISHSLISNVDFIEGTTTFTAPNGTQLNGKSSIVSRSGDSIKPGRLLDLLVVSGGTGIFDNSSGEFVLDTEINANNFTFTSVMKGQICLNVE